LKKKHDEEFTELQPLKTDSVDVGEAEPKEHAEIFHAYSADVKTVHFSDKDVKVIHFTDKKPIRTSRVSQVTVGKRKSKIKGSQTLPSDTAQKPPENERFRRHSVPSQTTDNQADKINMNRRATIAMTSTKNTLNFNQKENDNTDGKKC